MASQARGFAACRSRAYSASKREDAFFESVRLDAHIAGDVTIIQPDSFETPLTAGGGKNAVSDVSRRSIPHLSYSIEKRSVSRVQWQLATIVRLGRLSRLGL